MPCSRDGGKKQVPSTRSCEEKVYSLLLHSNLSPTPVSASNTGRTTESSWLGLPFPRSPGPNPVAFLFISFRVGHRLSVVHIQPSKVPYGKGSLPHRPTYFLYRPTYLPCTRPHPVKSWIVVVISSSTTCSQSGGSARRYRNELGTYPARSARYELSEIRLPARYSASVTTRPPSDAFDHAAYGDTGAKLQLLSIHPFQPWLQRLSARHPSAVAET